MDKWSIKRAYFEEVLRAGLGHSKSGFSSIARVSNGKTFFRTDEKTEALGDLSEIEESRLQELLDQKSMRKLGLNGNRQKVVWMGEVERFIEEGLEYLSTLPSGEAIVRLPAT